MLILGNKAYAICYDNGKALYINLNRVRQGLDTSVSCSTIVC